MQANTTNLPKSLQEENLLVDQLKNHLNYVCQQMSQTESRMAQLDKESSEFYCRLQRVQNAVCALKHKRYVQELIIDENDGRQFRQSEHTFVNSDVELRDNIVQATEQGLQLISQMFKPIAIQIPNQILNEHLVPNDIYEPIDSNLIRDLPPIIGSSGFNNWNVSDMIDRPTETNEITIGRVEVPVVQPKLQWQKEPSPAVSLKEVPVAEPIVPTMSSSLSPALNESVGPKPKNEFLAQLNERLATENLRKEPQKESVPETDSLPKRAEQPVPQQRKPKIEEPPKQLSKSLLVDDSSSDDSLFKTPPVLQKPAPPVKKVESQTEVVVKPIPVRKSAEMSAQKPTTKPVATPAKKSLLDDSDDSFDELFKSPTNFSATKPSIETKISPKLETTKQSPKPIEEPKVTPIQPVSKPVATAKRPEPKKRSIFDSSSSDEEPPRQSIPTKPPILAESTDDEMPKNVLNSVSNDFSSRLNQALLKRPSPSPSSGITKPDKEPDEKPVSKPSTPAKREPVENRKQESVAALRGKLGDSITKAHRISAGLEQKPPKESSSSDETDTHRPKVEDQNLIQTLKARPRPSRAPRSRPSILQTEEKTEAFEVKKEEKKVVEVKKEERIETKEVKKEEDKKLAIDKTLKSTEAKKPTTTSQKSPKEPSKDTTTSTTTTAVKKPEITSQGASKTVKPRKGLFDSDSDDPF